MWIVGVIGLCFGLLLAHFYYSLQTKEKENNELSAVRVLEKAVLWIFERRQLKEDEMDALLLESVTCGCKLDKLLERRTALYINEKRFPPGQPYKQFGLQIGYLYPYLPAGRQLLDEDIRSAERIYLFKQGKYSEALLDDLCRLFGNMGLEQGKYMLICIPASNIERMETRYMKFSHDLAARMDWSNGFGCLLPKYREPVHLTGERRILSEDNFLVDRQRLRGTQVVLLDDLLTTGLTVISVNNVLRRAGARPVAAVFIGRTLEKTVKWNQIL